jgi:hypothetical protein
VFILYSSISAINLLSFLSPSHRKKKLLYRWQENFCSARGIETIKNFSLPPHRAISRWLKNYASDISEKRHCVKMNRNGNGQRWCFLIFSISSGEEHRSRVEIIAAQEEADEHVRRTTQRGRIVQQQH